MDLNDIVWVWLNCVVPHQRTLTKSGPVIPKGELHEITKIQVSRLPISRNVKGPFIVQVGSCDVYFRCLAMLHSCGNLVIFSYSIYLYIDVTQMFRLAFFLKMVKANKILNYLSTTASRLYVGATGLLNG